jgi:tetratricopeptide (TPR) repeat protein
VSASGEERRDWGSVARRGGRVVRTPADRKPRRPESRPPSRPRHEGERWVDEGPVPTGAPPTRGKRPGRGRSGRRPPLPADVAADLARVGSPGRAAKWGAQLQEAAAAYDAERYAEARRLLEPLAAAAPGVAAVRELLGLTAYRMGRWRQAVTELEAAEGLTDSVEQHPVLADAHRALGHTDVVERLWDELRRGGVGVEVLTEGRIVTAGARADRGDLRRAIDLLEAGPVEVRRPREHHLRLWYALAALYERAGDLPRARALLRGLVAEDPGFADAATRLAGLG